MLLPGYRGCIGDTERLEMTVLTLPGGSTANINCKRTLCCLSGR